MTKTVPYPAPDFALPDQSGDTVSLDQFTSSWLVLYFYPKDNTPGCTIQACSIRDARDDLAELGVEVVGVSMDDAASHERFRDKHSLNFRLLTDSDGAVAKRYEALGKNMLGKMGILRKTFIIDPEGRVVKVYPRATPVGHGAQIISDIKQFQAASADAS